MTEREPTNTELLAAINELRSDLEPLRGELAARFDKLEATMAHNHELLQRAIRSYGR